MLALITFTESVKADTTENLFRLLDDTRLEAAELNNQICEAKRLHQDLSPELHYFLKVNYEMRRILITELEHR